MLDLKRSSASEEDKYANIAKVLVIHQRKWKNAQYVVELEKFSKKLK
jgi:hypothetical protein